MCPQCVRVCVHVCVCACTRPWCVLIPSHCNLTSGQNCSSACFSLQFHNKVTCFMLHHIEEPCSLGAHAAVIVPPTWIIKVKKPQVTARTLTLPGRCTEKSLAATWSSPPTRLRVPATSVRSSHRSCVHFRFDCRGLSQGTGSSPSGNLSS